MLIDEYGKEYYYDNVLKAKVYEIDGERIVIMDELYLGAKPKFNNQLDRNYYFFLNKKTLSCVSSIPHCIRTIPQFAG